VGSYYDDDDLGSESGSAYVFEFPGVPVQLLTTIQQSASYIIVLVL